MKEGDRIKVNLHPEERGSRLNRYNQFDPDQPFVILEVVGHCPVKKDEIIVRLDADSPLIRFHGKTFTSYHCREEELPNKWVGITCLHVRTCAVQLVQNESSAGEKLTGEELKDPKDNKQIMSTGKYKIGDKVLLRVRPKRRIEWDNPYSENAYLESRPFTIIGHQNKDGLYVVLIEDPTLASWVVNETHMAEHGISSEYRDKKAYGVEDKAIGGIAPHLSYCKECQSYNADLKNRLESGSELDSLLLQLVDSEPDDDFLENTDGGFGV